MRGAAGVAAIVVPEAGERPLVLRAEDMPRALAGEEDAGFVRWEGLVLLMCSASWASHVSDCVLCISEEHRATGQLWVRSFAWGGAPGKVLLLLWGAHTVSRVGSHAGAWGACILAPIMTGCMVVAWCGQWAASQCSR